MNYQDMINNAALYQEATKTLNHKPQLIRECEGRIIKLERELSELEDRAAKAALNDSMSKLNPLKFFAKKEEDYETKITELETKIKKEKRKIDGLKHAKTADFIDLEAVTVEALQIMDEQSEVIAAYKQKVLSAQAAYHAAIEEYQNELINQKSFAMKIQALERSVKAETFIPTYPGEQPYTDNRLQYEGFSPEITTKHRQRPNLTNTLFS